MKYDFSQIEAKWQKKWDENHTFAATNDYTKPKYYALVEFPYPSGQGLHVGHPRSYTALDIVARKRRLQGYNVLYPMGWDAFGLPTENFAIKNHVHPAEVTKKNVARFKSQLNAIGMSFDDVEKFYVAGAFGTYIRTASAVTIGLYPDLPEEKVACVGNSSLEGARALLLDRRHLPEVNGILEKMDYIQYGAIPDFVDSMSAARAIPHLDTARYPSVMKWKAQRQSRA